MQGGDSVRGVTVDVQGGLGNQLFIYAAGLSLATRLGCPLYLDTRWFQSSPDRDYALDQFVHSGIRIDGPQSASRRWPPVDPLLRRMWAKIPAPMHRVSTRNFRERGYAYDPSIRNVTNGMRLTGYFQSWRYFSDVASELRDQIGSVRDPTPWFGETRERLSRGPRWIALHVRRGDYLRPETMAYHGVVRGDFYLRSLRLVRGLIGADAPVVVFSDDPDAAEGELSALLGGVEVVRPPVESPELESLVLMSGGHSVITANSSFSWWAAWLGDRDGRPVVAPRPWFARAKAQTDDLLPPSWITLGT